MQNPPLLGRTNARVEVEIVNIILHGIQQVSGLKKEEVPSGFHCLNLVLDLKRLIYLGSPLKYRPEQAR